jgi:hypothetical protein
MPPKGRKRKVEELEAAPAHETASSSSISAVSESSGPVAAAGDFPSAPAIATAAPTRRSQRRQNLAEGRTVDPPQEKSMTLGQHMHQVRERVTKELLESDAISKYETFVNYEKEEVLHDLSLEERPGFHGQLYYTPPGPKQAAVLFIPLSVGAHPKSFSHICNSTSLQWNLEKMKLSSSSMFGLPNVVLVFVHGQHLEGLPEPSNGTLFKCLGLLGVQSLSSGSAGPGRPHEYIRATLVFDYVIRKKELEEQFGANVMKCKKNRYGCSLCE